MPGAADFNRSSNRCISREIMDKKIYVGIKHNPLKPDEWKCTSCRGKGYKISTISKRKHYRSVCFKCGGKGKFDWIDNILKNGST